MMAGAMAEAIRNDKAHGCHPWHSTLPGTRGLDVEHKLHADSPVLETHLGAEAEDKDT